MARAVTPLEFRFHNASETTAIGVRAEIQIDRAEGLIVRSERDMPREPEYEGYFGIRQLASRLGSPDVDVAEYPDRWIVRIEAGKIQPSADYWSRNALFIGGWLSISLDLEAVVFADNLPHPLVVPLQIQIEGKKEQMKWEDIGLRLRDTGTAGGARE